MSEVISNTIVMISSMDNDLELIKRNLDSNNKILIVELNGTNIQSWNDYISEIQNKFQFPTNCFDSIDRYLDWMRDLEWLNTEEFAIIINHFSDFVKDDPKLKSQIISHYADVILPFWQDEVEEVVVEGKAKPFMVYLVD